MAARISSRIMSLRLASFIPCLLLPELGSLDSRSRVGSGWGNASKSLWHKTDFAPAGSSPHCRSSVLNSATFICPTASSVRLIAASPEVKRNRKLQAWKCQAQLCFPMSKKDVQQGAHQLKVRAEGRRHILLSNQPAAAGAGREVHS